MCFRLELLRGSCLAQASLQAAFPQSSVMWGLPWPSAGGGGPPGFGSLLQPSAARSQSRGGRAPAAKPRRTRSTSLQNYS
eukprot:5459955-Alexandrium_andersonii.AAC.1